MKQLLLTSAIAIAALPATAFQADIDGTTFDIDTVYSHVVGPGVTQNHLLMTGGGRSIHIYSSTLRRSEGATTGTVEPRVLIGNDRCRTAETLTSMVKRHEATDDYRYLTGINGDFFITSAFAAQHEFGNAILGYPNMACAIDSKIAAPDMIDVVSRENALIMTSDNWYIDATDFKYRVLNLDGSVIVDAKAVNYPRRAGELMIYNSYMGATTATDATGRELVLIPSEGAKWQINKTVRFTVDSDWRQGGDSAIPADGIVLSCGPDYHNEFIDGLKKGDEVKLKIVIGLPAHENIKPDIVNIIGGDVRILNRGEITRQAIRWINTPSAKYQRSIVGFSEDRDMMTFVAIDGTGLSYYESAALLKALGCYDGLDLDGGGSTAIWSSNFGIYNQPRDGSERAIGNALFFALKAPVDNAVASIRFADHAVRLPIFGSYTPVIYGYNRYGQLVDTDVKGFTLSAPEALGTTDGPTLLVEGAGTHALTATLGEMSASVAVTVDDQFPTQPRYKTLLIDNYKPVAIALFATVAGKEMPVEPRAFTWSTSDGSIVSVDDSGIVSGITNGTATVTGVRGDISVSVDVTVQCPEDRLGSVVTELDKAKWRSSATGATVNSFSIGEDRSLTMDITLKAGAQHRGTLRPASATAIYSVPDAVEVEIDAAGAPLSGVSLALQGTGQRAVTAKKELTGSGTVTFDITEFAAEFTHGCFPFQFNSIALEFDGTSGSYSPVIKRIDAVYSSFQSCRPVMGDNLRPTLAGDMAVLPFTADRITLLDPTGRTVATASGVSAIRVPAPGLYILSATSPRGSVTAKIALR